MASKQTYPCFACRRAGYEIPIYLDGKDSEGRTKYLNEDGTTHQHKTKQQRQEEQPSQQLIQPTISDVLVQIKLLKQKMDSIIELLHSNNKK